MTARVLIVDDDRPMCELLVEQLAPRGFHAQACSSGERALELLNESAFDLVVSDMNMGGMSGLLLCERIADQHPDVLVLIITAFGSLDTAIGAIRAGAYDFVTKPFELDQLVVALNRAAEHQRLRREVRRLREEMNVAPIPGLVGESQAIRDVMSLVGRIASSDASVLVRGESGTGKELVARAIHSGSARRDGPFVAVNMAAVPAPLLESELFGHARGAFTDARHRREGLLVQAEGGTLVLDEIGDMPLELQPKLLRALEERTMRPVGGDRDVAFDVRIVALTNHDLQSAVDSGEFRSDLYFRLNVFELEIPPLRERGRDILLLAQHFLALFATRTQKAVDRLSPRVAKRLLAYPWPGNVRELRNCIEHAVALARFDELTIDDLPERVRDFDVGQVLTVGSTPAEVVSLQDLERQHILTVLELVGGNKTTAARLLQVGRKTLYRKLEKYGVLDRDD